jgi:hypothetical protein
MKYILYITLILASYLNLDAVDFSKDIEPVFKEHCLKCHGPDKQKGKFRIDRLASLLSGGNSAEAAIVPGNPEKSFLIKLIKHQEKDLEMPLKGDPLTQNQITLLSQWIKEGANTPKSYGPARELIKLTHWSFLPIVRPKIASDIDGFIKNRLSRKALGFSPRASKQRLIRRLYLIMLGIAPTPEEVEAFLADKRPDAWAKLVDKVLASPHYGERMAGLWLDLARFGETHGFEMNRERPSAWPYRDWVIDSFNKDMPYNNFVRAQIAGDAHGVDVATGFLVAGPVDQVKGQDPKLRQMQRMNELDDIINTTGTAFLGLTTGCARCHNHKFDPISQKDYYAMQAVFAGVHHGDRNLPLTPASKTIITNLNIEIIDLKNKLKKFIKRTVVSKLRPPVNARHNIEDFPEQKVKFVRFTIEASNRGQACIDELEIFSGKKNLALASLGARLSSSGDFKHPLHNLKQLNDGLYGNAKSWIVAKLKGWVQVELKEATRIDRIEWGRDRKGGLTDRLVIRYRIEGAMEPGKWTLLASSANRLPYKKTKNKVLPPKYNFDAFSKEEAELGKQWKDQLIQTESKKSKLEKSTKAYIGVFRQPGATHRLYRGEADAKRERVGPGGIFVFSLLKMALNEPEKKAP